MQWRQISIFCKKWVERLDQGEPWRTVASPGQAGVKSRKHKNQSWVKDVCGLGRGLGIEQSVWREGAYKERSYWFGVWGQVARTKENLSSCSQQWGFLQRGWLGVSICQGCCSSVGDSRGWGRSLPRVAKENARWPFAEVTSYKTSSLMSSVWTNDNMASAECRTKEQILKWRALLSGLLVPFCFERACSG